MQINLSGKQLEITPAMKENITTKLSRLDKYFREEPSARVTVSTPHNTHKIECTMQVDHRVLRAEAQDQDLYNALDMMIEKLARQLRKHKTKLMNKGHETIRFENIEEYVPTQEEQEAQSEQVGKIARRKKFGFKPMSEEEAALQMELLGHDFFVFTNAADDQVAIIYRRKDGSFGLLEQQ